MTGNEAGDAADKAFPNAGDRTRVQPGEYVTEDMAEKFNSGKMSRGELNRRVAEQRAADQRQASRKRH